MTLIVPNAELVRIITALVNQTLHLKLYSNNITPSATSAAVDFTEVVGGGYSEAVLSFSSWSFDSIGTATYVAEDFHFTGATNAPGTIYGYYIVDGSGNLTWAERFPDAVVPFTPTSGSFIRITPQIVASE